MTENNRSRIYFGTWIQHQDTLVLNYKYKIKARVFNKTMEEMHTELLFIKGFFIKDNRIFADKVFIAKKEFVPKPLGDNSKLYFVNEIQ